MRPRRNERKAVEPMVTTIRSCLPGNWLSRPSWYFDKNWGLVDRPEKSSEAILRLSRILQDD